jgi:hypothetical protein
MKKITTAAPEHEKASVGSRLAALGGIFLPGPMKEAYKAGLLPLLGAVVLGFVVFPLVIAFLAAFWLSLAKNSNIPLLQSLHHSYVSEIQQGFSMDDVVNQSANEQNTRLDYLHAIDFAIGRGGESPTIPIRLVKGQRVFLSLTRVVVNPPAATADSCVFTPPSGTLLDVSLGEQHFTSCPEVVTQTTGGCNADLRGDQWKKFLDVFTPTDDARRLGTDMTFSRAKGLESSCGVLHVQGSLTVYKDVDKVPDKD